MNAQDCFQSYNVIDHFYYNIVERIGATYSGRTSFNYFCALFSPEHSIHFSKKMSAQDFFQSYCVVYHFHYNIVERMRATYSVRTSFNYLYVLFSPKKHRINFIKKIECARLFVSHNVINYCYFSILKMMNATQLGRFFR